MKKQLAFFYTLLVITLMSCETNQEKIERANSLVKQFMSEMSMDNYPTLIKIYPEVKNIKGGFWMVNDYKIESTEINANDEIVVYLSYKRTGQTINSKIKFIVNKVNGDYIILSSKGLSYYFDSALYRYCISKKHLIYTNMSETEETDVKLSKICSENKLKFKNLSKACLNYVKEFVSYDKSLTNLTIDSYTNSLHGSFTINNNTSFELSSYGLNFSLLIADKSGNIIAKKRINNLYIVKPYSKQTIEIFNVNLPRGSKKFSLGIEETSIENFGYCVVGNLEFAESIP